MTNASENVCNYFLFDISIVYLPYILIGITTISELSDAFDGFFARKYHQVSDLGKIIDPMADSISRISCFFVFTQGRVGLPVLLVLVFLYRDSIISTLRTVCALKGFALAARPSGKVKALVQAIAIYLILLLMIPNTLGYLSTYDYHLISLYIVACAALYTIYSGVDYFVAHSSHIKQILGRPGDRS